MGDTGDPFTGALTAMKLSLLPLVLSAALLPTPATAQAITLFTGAKVWTGSSFKAREIAIKDGQIVPVPAKRANVRVVDLGGKFVSPAYANAHCHLTSPTRESSDGFLRDGVFYVWNPNTVVLSAADKSFFGQPGTVDVKIAQGGITESGGHPEPLYTETLAKYVYKGRDRAWFLGNAFHYGRTPGEIRTTLQTLKAQRADFVKAYLLHSEEYQKRAADPRFVGARGLNPKNMPFLVREAKRQGFLTAVHVETTADLLAAAQAGAAVAAHLPGYGGNVADESLITATQAQTVARGGMRVTPTFSVGAGRKDEKASPEEQQRLASLVAERHRQNMLVLKNAGARFLMGTDGRGQIFDEAERWVAIGAMNPREVLRIVYATGPYLFPERRIGCLQAGCEADFLVLSTDPSSDIRALRSIEQRYKGGQLIAIAD